MLSHYESTRYRNHYSHAFASSDIPNLQHHRYISRHIVLENQEYYRVSTFRRTEYVDVGTCISNGQRVDHEDEYPDHLPATVPFGLSVSITFAHCSLRFLADSRVFAISTR